MNKLVQINEDWGKIPIHTKIFLPERTRFSTFEGNILFEKGFYFISGFWANAMGLCYKYKNAIKTETDIHIPSISLKKFQRMIKIE